MLITEKLDLLYTNEVIQRFKLEAKASKILIKFVEWWQKDKEKYLSLAEIRRNFRTITTEDMRIITHEFEKMRLIVGKVKLAQFYFKFNDDPSKWTRLSKNDVDTIIEFKNKTDEKLRKKFERSKKFIEEFEQKQQIREEVQKIQQQGFNEKRSAVEIHEQDHVNREDKDCRLCQLAKGTFGQEQKDALGF